MTAEIAVLNKLAVALAADSAVTIKSPEKTKIFRTVNKLFALSKHHPVGIMVHGNAEFMGVPWEVIIKAYRENLGTQSFATLKEYLEDFIGTVQTDSLLNLVEEERGFVRNTIQRALREVRDDINRQVERVLQRRKIADEEVASIVGEVLKARLGPRSLLKDVGSLPVDHGEKIAAKYGPELDKTVSEVFGGLPIDQDAASQLRDYAIGLFTKDSFPPDQTSGIVVAGFGTRDIYPSVEWIDLQGRVEGVLKSRAHESTKVRVGLGAAIAPFAQREEVDAFMMGVNPKYFSAVSSFFRKLLDDYPEKILATLTGMGDVERQNLLEKWKAVSLESVARFHEGMQEFSSETFTDPIMSAVEALPKDELATMAETLVNLTSFKRKVTLDDETVGGAIDVAVISKGDGFVWIKRKHYFNLELNPHFTTQYFNRGSSGVGDGK